MHQTLSDLSRNVVIDANVILNACFVSDSSARYAMDQLPNFGFIPVVDKAIEEEAFNVLRKLQIKHALWFDPVDVLRSYMAQSRVFTLAQSPVYQSPHINKADQHVAAAAIYNRAWVLTGDIKFAAECQSDSIPVRLPWDLIMEAAMHVGSDPPLHYVLRFIGVSASQGSLFARVIPGNWGGMTGVGRFTVCDVENVGRLLYDSDKQEWVFSTTLGYEAKASCRVRADEQWMVCGSYDISTRSGRGSATLRVSNLNGTLVNTTITLNRTYSSPSPGHCTFGHAVTGTESWNGHIRKVVVSPRSMSKQTWAALKQIPEAAPDPTAGNILEAALKKVRSLGGQWIIPSEQEIREAWV